MTPRVWSHGRPSRGPLFRAIHSPPAMRAGPPSATGTPPLATPSAQATPDLSAKGQKRSSPARLTSPRGSRASPAICSATSRYVGIEIGIGGLQPPLGGRTSSAIATGDCKDKATLLRAHARKASTSTPPGCWSIPGAGSSIPPSPPSTATTPSRPLKFPPATPIRSCSRSSPRRAAKRYPHLRSHQRMDPPRPDSAL